MSAEQLIRIADSIRAESENHIPHYAYGDNEAACDMASRLNSINRQAAGLVNPLSAHPDTGKEDGERLDWLERNFEQVFQRITSDGFFYFDHKEQRPERRYTLRAAIDAAQSAPNEGRKS
jgi:hypothetical protein